MLHQLPQSLDADRFDSAAEADHRIANHLAMIVSLIRLSADAARRRSEPVSGDDLAMELGGIGAKVESVARIHRQLSRPGSDGDVDVAHYIREIATATVASLAPEGAVELEFFLALPCAAPARQATAIGLIVCELVTNAIKYAHPTGVGGHIRVSCQVSGRSLIVEVEDDGVGLPDAMDPTRDGHLGLRSIRSLAAQMNGALEFRNHALGVRIVLRVPVVEEAAPVVEDTKVTQLRA